MRITIIIQRVICAICGRTHAVLLSCFVPYSQIPLEDQIQIIISRGDKAKRRAVLDENILIDDCEVCRIISNFKRHWEQRLLFAIITSVNGGIRFWQFRKYLVHKCYFKDLILHISGIIIGVYIYRMLPETLLKTILGCFAIVISICNFYKKESEWTHQPVGISALFYKSLLFFGGVMQGAFVCGGPLIVVYCARYYGYDKNTFFSMQSGMSFPGAFFVLLSHIIAKNYNQGNATMGAFGLLALFGAILVSDRLRKNISSKGMRKAVNIVLFISGVSTLIQTLSLSL